MRAQNRLSDEDSLAVVSFKAVMNAARLCGTMFEAAERLGIPDIAGLLSENGPLRDAWERGRFLRRLAELAEGPVCEAVVAQRLSFDSEEAFFDALEADIEARDVWIEARHQFFKRAKETIMTKAAQGSAHAIRVLERLQKSKNQSGNVVKKIDFHRLSREQMATATGLDSKQLGRFEKQNLPRHPDGTYSLPEFVDWLRRDPSRGRPRNYRQQSSTVEKQILRRIEAVIHDVLLPLYKRERDDD